MATNIKKQSHSYDYDVLIVGSGPGGYETAIRSTQLGFRTGIVEKDDTLGGICLNWGCIPTKALLKQAEVFQTINHADRFGIKVSPPKIQFDKIVNRSREVASSMAKGVSFLMKKNKVVVKKGYGHLISPHTLEITRNGHAKETITANTIIIATGASPNALPSVEIDKKTIITSREAMVLKEVPKSIVIIGAGAIGVEFSYLYRSFGAKVTLIEYMTHILPNEDEEVSTALEKSFKKKGIDILTGTKVVGTSLTKEGASVEIETSKGEKKKIQGDYVLVAVGMKGNVENIGLENIGIKVKKGFISVDEFGETSVKGIYAIGDVSGGMLLAHRASAQGIRCIEKVAGLPVEPIMDEEIPACTYCQPSVAHIGLTEKQAKEKNREILVGKFPFVASGKAVASGHTEGFVKLIFDKTFGELLGAHIIGSEATEMISELCIAKKMEATAEWIHKTIHPHPTFSEAVKEAAAVALGEAINI